MKLPNLAAPGSLEPSQEDILENDPNHNWSVVSGRKDSFINQMEITKALKECQYSLKALETHFTFCS